jgi:hypothetical protein
MVTRPSNDYISGEVLVVIVLTLALSWGTYSSPMRNGAQASGP